MTIELSAGEARRIALAAQGFASRKPAKPSIRHVMNVTTQLHALQLDSVNVLVRAHYLPAFSRLGPYPLTAMDRLVNDRHDLVEVDAHQASLVPVALEPLLRTRRTRASRHWTGWRSTVERKRPGYVDEILQAVTDSGPIAVGDLLDAGRVKKPTPADLSVRRRDGEPYAESSLRWWRPSDGKHVLDGLLAEGRLALAGRGPGFQRLYDLTERVLPPSGLEKPEPPAEEVRRELVGLSARALGVATAADLAGYFMLKVADVRVAAPQLVERGDLVPARVEGWKQPAFLDARTKPPKTMDARALLSPFDSLTWSRDRTKRLFDFDFSFEIYVPEAKRRFGYYVLPFLLGDRLVARVDLKADRKRSVLMIQGAFGEREMDRSVVVPALGAELRDMASWLELDEIEVRERGDLAPALDQHVPKLRA